MITPYFRRSKLWDPDETLWLKMLRSRVSPEISAVQIEKSFLVNTDKPLDKSEQEKLKWLLRETFEPDKFGTKTMLEKGAIEVGPRLAFVTPKSSNSIRICQACGLDKITRIEQTKRFSITMEPGSKLNNDQRAQIHALIHDRMTETIYKKPLTTFESGKIPDPVRTIPVITDGVSALNLINKELGLSMDNHDIGYYHKLFSERLNRNPNDVELFHLGTSNSEHSRHGYFKGRQVIDGQVMPYTLMDIIMHPWKTNPGNSVIAFCDDSSAIRGTEIKTIVPSAPGRCSKFEIRTYVYHPTLTAETHCFPTGIASYPGAETGTGGRIRDNQAVGRGGLVIAGGAAYCVGNLHIPGYIHLTWEDDGWEHPPELTPPLEILIEASNGASDYGNRFGEPVIYGYVRSFGMPLPDGYRSWFKPIMFTVGAGQVCDEHIEKGAPEKGMLVIQIGGPAYGIGIGGGSASSMIQGENVAELDFNAVQRGDAQVEQCYNRFIRACSEMGPDNPMVKPQDFGAGGACNGLQELVYPAGAYLELRELPSGDKTLSVKDLWGNEAQERFAFLIKPESFDLVKEICEREGIPFAIVGRITGDGWLIVHDENDGSTPVNLPMDAILGKLPQKTFEDKRIPPKRNPLVLPDGLTVKGVLEMILRLLSVGSKRFLTTKVDRSVTGLVAQQQCIGPNQITLSDFAVIAQSHLSERGVALSIGEQPVIGLNSPEVMARMAIAEALLNMVGASITDLKDIKFSANWMLAAKLPGEGAWLYDAAVALRDICEELGIAPDGGKDSLSMAAKTRSPAGNDEIVKAPGQLVVSFYATMKDLNKKVTADIKKPGNALILVDLADGRNRLGASPLAQVHKQVGDNAPDIEDINLLAKVFRTINSLVKEGKVLSVHDSVGDGLIVALLEMAFAGNAGLKVNIKSGSNAIETLFSGEARLVLECEDSGYVKEALRKAEIPFQLIGTSVKASTKKNDVSIRINGTEVLSDRMTRLRSVWEQTSAEIDKLQANPMCVEQEQANIAELITPPPFRLSYLPIPTQDTILRADNKPRVAVIRAEGSNGDREMSSAFFLAGFEVWDITMSDLITGKITLDGFRGIVFVGGFTYADVLDAAKGWAGLIMFNKTLSEQFKRFYERPDTFSLGVCNGCQLMALLGWVPWQGLSGYQQPRFIRNLSGRFESRFSSVIVKETPSIMLQQMEGSILGVWVAHGEGRCYWPDPGVLDDVCGQNLVPLQFVDPNGSVTEQYPFNPNGSGFGITSLCSNNGRHIAMMPHPERLFWKYQWPYWPSEWLSVMASPWLTMFQNARKWCEETVDCSQTIELNSALEGKRFILAA